MIGSVAPRSGMYVGRPRYGLVRSFIQCFGSGRDDEVLDGFQRWLASQPQHFPVINYAWSYLILREVINDVHGDKLVHLEEEELVYPDEDARAIEHLFVRLREFLAIDEATR